VFIQSINPATKTLMVALLAVLLAACGGSAGNTPADTAKAFYATTFAENPNIDPFVCASNRTFAETMMQAMTAMKTQMNVSMFDTSGLKFETSAQSGDTATVTVSGKVKGTVAGQPVEIDYPPTPITLKNENGWKICV